MIVGGGIAKIDQSLDRGALRWMAPRPVNPIAGAGCRAPSMTMASTFDTPRPVILALNGRSHHAPLYYGDRYGIWLADCMGRPRSVRGLILRNKNYTNPRSWADQECADFSGEGPRTAGAAPRAFDFPGFSTPLPTGSSMLLLILMRRLIGDHSGLKRRCAKRIEHLRDKGGHDLYSAPAARHQIGVANCIRMTAYLTGNGSPIATLHNEESIHVRT
jgi:hypothetical protein